MWRRHPINTTDSDSTKRFSYSGDLGGVFAAIEDSSAILLTDPEGIIVSANENFYKLTGYAPEDLVGKDSRILNTGAQPKELMKNLWDTIRNGRSWHEKLSCKKKDGSFLWTDTYIAPVFNEKHEIRHFVAVRFDITKFHTLEETQQEQDRTLKLTAKMVALGEVSASLAHEINNLLTIILGKTSLLVRQIEAGKLNNEKLSSDLKNINSIAERISCIVKSLKRFSRNEIADAHTPIDAKIFIEDSLMLYRAAFKETNVELRIVLDLPECVKVMGHSAQLTQVIGNLLSNAIDAVVGRDEKWVEISAASSESHLKVSVTDSGNGISVDVADKIMTAFYTTKPTGKGTGLGLSISTKIIQAHKGSLSYNAKSPKTQFVIELPLYKENQNLQ